MSMIRPLLSILGLVLLWVAGSGCSGEASTKPLPPALSSQPNTTSYALSWWRDRFEAKCAEMKRGEEIRILLVGDSIFHYLEKPENQSVFDKLRPFGVLNFGFSSDRTEHCLWRVENAPLDGIDPDLTVVLIGTNNTNQRDDSPEDVVAGIEQICRTLRENLSSTRILVLKILPKGRDPDSAIVRRDAMINQMLNTLPERISNLAVADCTAAFLDADGQPRRDRMPDYLHPNAAGYEPILQVILDNLPEA